MWFQGHHKREPRASKTTGELGKIILHGHPTSGDKPPPNPSSNSYVRLSIQAHSPHRYIEVEKGADSGTDHP